MLSFRLAVREEREDMRPGAVTGIGLPGIFMPLAATYADEKTDLQGGLSEIGRQ